MTARVRDVLDPVRALGRQPGQPWTVGATSDVTPSSYCRSMDEMTYADRGAVGSRTPARSEPQQAKLPFEHPQALPLPFDDEADAPIGFALTARARRAVAPDAVPPLVVVGGDADEDSTDTRPARARALRRAGAGVGEIARQLAVDELLVRAWAGDVPDRDRHPSRALRAAAVLAAPAAPGTASGARRSAEASVSSPTGGEPSDGGDAPEGPVRRFAASRRAAAADARRRLTEDAGFAMGVGLLAGLVNVDRHTVGFQTSRPELAARLLAWSFDRGAVDPREVRVVLRLGTAVAGDVTRHRWASWLGIGVEQVATTRWRHAPDTDAAEAFVRIADPEFAARVAGWCDALLQPEVDPADIAF